MLNESGEVGEMWAKGSFERLNFIAVAAFINNYDETLVEGFLS